MAMEAARALFEQYVQGWKDNDIEKVVAPLAEDCVITESHGPTYRGIEMVRKWFDFWLKKEGRVLQWDILSFYFLEKENIAFAEWNFACNVRGKDYLLPGISVIKYKEGKIAFLHEYRMTKEPYEWEPSQLNPE